MNFWSISHKCLLILFILSTLLYTTPGLSPWYIFICLIYLSLNLAIHIFNHRSSKTILLILSIVLMTIASIYVSPLFLLTYPITIYELIALFTKRNSIALIAFIPPLFILNQEEIILYLFIALLSLSFGLLLRRYVVNLLDNRHKIEQLTEQLTLLTKIINDNTEYIKQSDYTIKLEERNRISQEIHDKVGHSMTGALIQMEASKRLFTTDHKKAAELLQNAIQISKEGIESIRLVLNNTKPPVEQLGINRVRLLADEFSSQHNIQTVLSFDGELELITPIHWSIIIGNVKEALNNILKYARATKITIHIEVLRTLIKVMVVDNGNGAAKVIKGLGIIGMEERAASIDGTVIVDGTTGFSVTTLLPISLRHEKVQ